MAETAATTRTEAKGSSLAPGAPTPAPIVMDLGKQRRKQVKALRKGEGRLMDEISASIDELRLAGTVDAHVQPIVIIVREKRRKTKGIFPLL